MKNYYNKHKGFFQFVWIAAGVILAWYICWCLVNYYVPGFTDRGAFGDRFGFANSLFSALAFAGIIYSIILQQRELSLQRKEIVDTRQEFKDQNFQNIYFNLLRTQREIVEELKIKVPRLEGLDLIARTIAGRQAFHEIEYEMNIIYETLQTKTSTKYDPEEASHQLGVAMYDNPENSEKEEGRLMAKFTMQTGKGFYNIKDGDFEDFHGTENILERIRIVYRIFFEKHSREIGHYFRHVYHILLFLKTREENTISHLQMEGGSDLNARIETEKKEFYGFAQFLKAQMDTPELFTLFYNSFHYPKAKALLIYYKMLDTLHENDLIYPEHNIVPEFLLRKEGTIIPA